MNSASEKLRALNAEVEILRHALYRAHQVDSENFDYQPADDALSRMSDANQHSGLPPVSYEALEANLRSTHANLDFCIEQRQRLEEQLETFREVLDQVRDVVNGWDIDPPASRSYEERNGIIQRITSEAFYAVSNPAKEQDA